MIKCYFGVPGVGKSTILVREYKKNRRKYDHIYSINIQIKGVPLITKEDLEKYKFKNTLILWDEITMDADNREFKSFSHDLRDFFILHRHLGCDIVYATQNFENVDKKVRDLTSELWYMSKSVIPLFKNFTSAKRIYRKININEFTSDLTLGYRFCNFLESIFVSNFKLCFRPFYYRYFDTHDELSLKGRLLYEEKDSISNSDFSGIVIG
ncbi:MAG: hypothetical protein E7167_04020 [Firmicutes bacterium]|nr:hypothetical protein [Bacillota bacterium]